MPRPLIPNVLDGPLTAEQESAIWQAVMGQQVVMAQPLTGWLLVSNSIWDDKRALSTRLAKVLGISHKTWEAGLPKKEKKLRHSVESLNGHIHRALVKSGPECAARRERAIKRTMQSISEDPTALPCTFFQQTLGIAGGSALEMLAVRIDEISNAVLKRRIGPDEVHTLIVDAVEGAGGVPAGSVAAAPELDPGLDATMMLMARLDRDCVAELHLGSDTMSSLFALLADMSPHNHRRSARHRLLDLYYAIATLANGRSLPMALPSVRELEDTLLGGPPASGGQSWIVRWRTGTKHIRFEDVEDITAHLAVTVSKDVNHVFRILWLMAQFWELVERGGPEAVGRAGSRYRTWWSAMGSSGRKETLLSEPYWGHFEPHA